MNVVELKRKRLKKLKRVEELEKVEKAGAKVDVSRLKGKLKKT